MERNSDIIKFSVDEQDAALFPPEIEVSAAMEEYERLEAHILKVSNTYKKTFYNTDETRFALKAQRRFRLAGMNVLLNDLNDIRTRFKELAAPELAAGAIESSLEELQIEGLDLGRIHER